MEDEWIYKVYSCWVVDCEWVTFEWTIIIISASHLKECEVERKRRKE